MGNNNVFLISECGNNHWGSLEKAKSLARMSKDCGADAAKFQAFKARDINGSMPYDFYAMCELGDGYQELLEYGIKIRFPIFFSVFSIEYNYLNFQQKYRKIAGSQFKEAWTNSKSIKDDDNYFISVREEDIDLIPDNSFENTKLLYVSEYLTTNPKLENIDRLKKKSKVVGYSDHTNGVFHCIEAVEKYGAQVIEKHFTDEKYKVFQEVTYRDTQHGIGPKQMELLAKRIKG